MAPKKSTLPGAAAKEPVGAPADEIITPGEEEADTKPVETPKPAKSEEPEVDLSAYDKTTKKKAKELILAGKTINGTESADLINTLWEEFQEEDREEVTEQEEVDGVPNRLRPRTETLSQNGKPVNFPIFFVAAVKGGFALYNEVGQRVSPVCTSETSPNAGYINRAAARNNAERRRHRLPNDAV